MRIIQLAATLTLFLLLLPPCVQPHAADAVSSRAAPAKDFDLQGFIDSEMKLGRNRVVVPPGRYRVSPKRGSHLIFKDLAGVEIIADGVEMVCTQTIQAIGFENCCDIHLKGMMIDYDPLPFTEGRITALAPDKGWVEFEVIAGYPEDTLEERVEIYDSSTGELRRETTGWSKEFEPLGNHRYRIAKRPGYRFDPESDTEQVGDILVTNNRLPANVVGHAISATRCSALTLECVTVYASPCFGFIEHSCNGTTYLRCKVDRRPPAEDPVKRGFARMRSLNADAFHSVEAAKGPAILDCIAKFQGDDCVNIHGTYHLVTASNGYELRVAALGRMTIEPGDPVEFLPYEGTRPPDATATKIDPDGLITDEEKAFIRKLHIKENNRRRLLDDQARFFKLMLDRSVPLPMGSAVCSGNRVGNGFVVKKCDFGYNRSRGILIKASHGEVSRNTISHGWMAAVLVAPEFWWFESTSSSDLVIQGNTIVGCRRPAIVVIASGGNGKLLPSGAHRNIAITGNIITRSVWPNIRVTSTDRLVVKDNQLSAEDPERLVPPQPHRWNWRTASPSAIVTELCVQPDVQK